jgi:DNA-binding beta-propeller fold protein YncE
MHAEGRAMVGAMGTLFRGEQAAGAWIDLFDPAEEPFGATRRSISVGRDPRSGTVTDSGQALWFVDHVSNAASLLRVESTTDIRTMTVGQGPVAAFTLGKRYGVTLDSTAETATIVDLQKMERLETLVLDGEPRGGVMSPDGNTLVVSLGGNAWPPRASGAAIIEGDPPKLVATLPTGQGASRVAISKDGTRAVVANYGDKSLTVIER